MRDVRWCVIRKGKSEASPGPPVLHKSSGVYVDWSASVEPSLKTPGETPQRTCGDALAEWAAVHEASLRPRAERRMSRETWRYQETCGYEGYAPCSEEHRASIGGEGEMHARGGGELSERDL